MEGVELILEVQLIVEVCKEVALKYVMEGKVDMMLEVKSSFLAS